MSLKTIFDSGSAIRKILTGTAVVGGVTLAAAGVLKWTGTDDLGAIKEQFNTLHGWYENALYNVGQYKEALAKANGFINDYKTKDDQLIDKVKEYESKIADLNKQIEQLQSQGGTDTETIKELQQQVKDLQAELDKAVSEDDYNQLEAEVARLQGELKKANSEVASLRSYIDGEMAKTTATTDKVNADDLTGQENLKLYLTYNFIDKETDRHEAKDLATLLGNYHDLDAYRESPIKLYYANKSQYYFPEARENPSDDASDYLDTNVVFMNNTNAFNKIATHDGWVDITNRNVNRHVVDGDKQIYNRDKRTLISLVNDTKWKSVTGQETDNGTK